MHNGGRPTKKTEHLAKLKKLGIFTYKDANSVGIAKDTLRKLVANQEVKTLIKEGYYAHPDIDFDPTEEEYAIACKKFGDTSVIGSLSALFHYNLIEQVPQQIWVLVPPNKYTKSTLYRLMRTKINLKIGIETKSYYRIVNLDRAIAEAFYHHKKIGIETALMAAKTAIKNKLTTPAKIMDMSEQLEIVSSLDPHFAAITTEAL